MNDSTMNVSGKRERSDASMETPARATSNNNDNPNNELVAKRFKASEQVTRPLLCPITHELMVDPVLAEDGHTYERSSIEEWLSRKNTSPLIPNKKLLKSKLVAVQRMHETIEALVETGAVEDKLSDSWKKKKKALDLFQANILYDEGKVLEAAKLGLPIAQGEVSMWYFFGHNGVEKDLHESLKWARKAAEGGDSIGQFRLGWFYSKGIPGILTRDVSEAISWYEKAAKKGNEVAMLKLGSIYENGGCELDEIFFLQKAAFWYEKGAENSNGICMFEIGKFYYEGKGVEQNHRVAREWFEKCLNSYNIFFKRFYITLDIQVKFLLGKMMVRGEGGPKDIISGIGYMQDAASMGHSNARKFVKAIESLD